MSITPSLPPFPENEIVHSARQAVERLQQDGHEAFFVGGCVRDWLLRIEPYDIDIATSAPPERVVELFEKTRMVGAHFGVVLVLFPHATIEVATFRRDGEYIDFRRPVEVHFGTIEEDAARRDFTINALFYDPIHNKLVDHFTGALDLRRRILRAIGNPRKRFEEDALRLIRAVRLAIRYDLQIEANTRKAIIARAANLAEISKERIGEELLRILTGPNPGGAMRLMSELELWAHVIPEIEALKGVEQGPQHHPEGDVFEHTIQVLNNLPQDPAPALGLAALLHDIGKPSTQSHEEGRIRFFGHQKVGAEMARKICRNLKFSNELADTVVDLVDHHMMFMDVWKMKPANLQRFVGQPFFQLHLDLHRADSLGSHGDLDAYQYCIDQRRKLSLEHGESILPPLLVSGDDLIDMGLEPGPLFRELLDHLRDEQLEGRITTRDEALKYINSHANGRSPSTSTQNPSSEV